LTLKVKLPRSPPNGAVLRLIWIDFGGRRNILMARALEHFWEFPVRLISVSVTIFLWSSAALAQQSPGTTGDTLGHPPPLPGPPPISEPSSATEPAPAASTPRASEPAPKGYAGAYAPVTPIRDTGRAILGPDGSTIIVKAIPCSIAARETDGFATCIGIPGAIRPR
jgi:hypothetical protein